MEVSGPGINFVKISLCTEPSWLGQRSHWNYHATTERYTRCLKKSPWNHITINKCIRGNDVLPNNRSTLENVSNDYKAYRHDFLLKLRESSTFRSNDFFKNKSNNHVTLLRIGGSSQFKNKSAEYKWYQRKWNEKRDAISKF